MKELNRKKTLTIIDFLNMLANNDEENLPQKIKWLGRKYEIFKSEMGVITYYSESNDDYDYSEELVLSISNIDLISKLEILD